MLGRLNSRQRIALAVAVAFAAFMVGGIIDHELTAVAGGGWFGYAPNTSVQLVERADGPDWWVRVAWWLLVTAVATVVILRVLRDPPAAGDD